MRFNIISNLNNGVGLQQDYELLKHELEIRGHTVRGVQFNVKPLIVERADVNIFLEVVNPVVFGAAPKQWVVPNPEWWFEQWNHCTWDLVLAKTRDCERIFKGKMGDRCQYIGWMARDLYDPAIPRQRKFLHVAGKSQFKNTAAVVMGCHQARVGLTVVGCHVGAAIPRVCDKDLKTLMNSHFCHVMPSQYEGYGHVLNEALGVGQIVVTTDAPPMNELSNVYLVPSMSTVKHHAGLLHKVSSVEVAKAVTKIMGLTQSVIDQYREQGRAQFQQRNQEFQKALDSLVGHGV